MRRRAGAVVAPVIRREGPAARAGGLAAVLVATTAASCGSGSDGPPSGAAPTSAAPEGSATPSPSAIAPAPAARLDPVGSAIARSPKPGIVVVVDEDHLALRLVDVKVDPPNAVEVAMPGRPAQVVALQDALLVTIRDPGMLLRLVPDGTTFKIAGTARLPADAWGVSLSKDGKRALVSSAWSRRVSAVDLEKLAAGGEMEPTWSLPVAREPRGIVATTEDRAYVTHLVGADLTRIDGIAGSSPTVARVSLPASPLRAPSGKRLPASLGYAAAVSPAGDRLFAPRHAIGALGREAWFGAATVDVLLLGTEEALAPPHIGNATVYRSQTAKEVETPDTKANVPADPLAPFLQPRDVRVRASAGTILVAGEGDARLVELDATAIDPTLAVVRTYELEKQRDPILGIPTTCGAPAGVALSEDESTAYVLCRSTYSVAVVPLAKVRGTGAIPADAPAAPRVTSLASDPLGEEISVGRRLFYDGVDAITSGGLACAGCHPEGRDDGFTWHEATFDTPDGGTRANFVGTPEQVPDIAKAKGVPRQTPMLAGRVDADGPYGWMAESKTLGDRIGASFGLHRWGGLPKHAPENVAARAGHLVGFVRKGLVPPALSDAPPSPEAERGKVVFESREAACSTCHRPESGHTDRVAYPLRALPVRPGYDPDPKGTELKTPSLRFVGGTEPYLHDGSAPSLEALLESNGDRMGKTSHLSPAERADLLAYLRSL